MSDWQPIEMAPRERKTPVLVALIRDGCIYRVSDAEFNGLGFYTKFGGQSCHWATHWAPLPLPAPPEAP